MTGMNGKSLAIFVALGALSALGCDDEPAVTDGGFDAGDLTVDGGPVDAGSDGGGPIDSGTDAGTCTPERTWFQCTDGVDNDCDTMVDTDDGCSICPPAAAPEAGAEDDATQCGDGLDNDCDGYVDCQDFNCRGQGSCSTSEDTDALCMDGVDNDGDGRIDCAQRSCATSGPCSVMATVPETDATVCGNGLDDDGDGRVDCDDDECAGLGFCAAAEDSDALCMDGEDNDGDGHVDCVDSQCASVPYCTGEDSDETCTDGMDNDHDGRIDCRDRDCLARAVCRDPETTCDDGMDEDMDGVADCQDSDCASECAATACSATNWFGSCDGALTCAEGVCARSLSSFTFPADQPLLITEMMPNPVGITDANGEYTEVMNVSMEPVNIDGLTFIDDDPAHTAAVIDGVRILMPGETVLFVANDDPLANGGLMNGVDVRFSLTQGGDTGIISYMGTVIHSVSYPSSLNDLENTGAPAVGGLSFNLDQAFIDGTTATPSWCTTPISMANQYEATGPNYGTPGAANVACP